MIIVKLLPCCCVCFCSLQEGGGTPGSPLSMSPGKITSSSIAQFNDPFYCLAGEVHVDFFLRAKAFLQLMGFVCFWKSLFVSLGDLFFNIAPVLWRYSENHLEKLKGWVLPVPALWHSCSSWISPPLVGPLQRKRVNGEVSAYFAAQESTMLNWLSHEPASSPSL